MLFITANKYPKYYVEEQWVLDICNKTKQVIGLILHHKNISKILRKYSDECIETCVRFHTLQTTMDVRFTEYLSRSLNSLLGDQSSLFFCRTKQNL